MRLFNAIPCRHAALCTLYIHCLNAQYSVYIFAKTVKTEGQGYFRFKKARYNAGIRRFFGGHACRRSRSARYRMYIQKSNPVYRAVSHRTPIRFASSKGAAGSLYYFRASCVRARQGKIFSAFSAFSFSFIGTSFQTMTKNRGL